jgi:zinc protease
MHRQYFRPDNAILIIGGDITGSSGVDLARRYFGNWIRPKTKIPAPPLQEAASKDSGRILVIDKPDAGQAAVFLVSRGIDRKDPDYFRGLVSNSVLSGYSGRLNQEIRIKRGLSYGAGSALEARRGIGPFVASTQTKNESAPEVADLLLKELERLYHSPPAEEELTPRKAVLIGGFSRSMETVNGLVTRFASLAMYDVSLDEIDRYIAKVQAVSSDDVRLFAGDKLTSKGSSVIIVGNAKLFLEPLRKLFSKVEMIPLAELDLNSKSLRKKR